MMKFTTLALGAAMFLGGAVGMVPQTEQAKPVYYRDSPVYYTDSDDLYDDTGVDNSVLENSQISYTTRTVDQKTLAYQYPTYFFSPAIGSCGAIGGGNLIGFYDRYYEELIPNHVAGEPFLNTYIYNLEDSYVINTIRTLYDYMGTSSSGTTEDGFKNGIVKYCKEKGLSVTYTSCMKNRALNYEKAQEYILKNQPIVLFLSGYNVSNMGTENNVDYFSTYVSPNTHIMIGFGYRTFVYDGNRTYRYFAVSSGITGHMSGLYNIDYKTKINNALAVNIY